MTQTHTAPTRNSGPTNTPVNTNAGRKAGALQSGERSLMPLYELRKAENLHQEVINKPFSKRAGLVTIIERDVAKHIIRSERDAGHEKKLPVQTRKTSATDEMLRARLDKRNRETLDAMPKTRWVDIKSMEGKLGLSWKAVSKRLENLVKCGLVQQKAVDNKKWVFRKVYVDWASKGVAEKANEARQETLAAMSGKWEAASEIAARLGITTSTTIDRLRTAHRLGLIERKGVHRYVWRKK